MWFWSFICSHNIAISIIATAWILGVIAGRKISRIKTIFIKNPFSGKKSSIIDDSSKTTDPFRYKREYVINLIIDKKRDFPYDDISAFTVRLEDIIENNQLKAYSISNTKKGRNKKGTTTGIKKQVIDRTEIDEIDLDKIVLPEDYRK